MPKGMNPSEEAEFDEGVLGAIDAGIELSGDIGDPEAPEPEVEHDIDAPPVPELDIGTEPPPEPEPESEDDPEKTPDDNAAGDPDDGTPVPTEEGDPAAPVVDEPEVDPKPSDEFGKLDEDAKPATKERFETMKTRFDEVSNELERISDQNNAWMETIQRTKASPDQLGASLSYLEDINTGTPESLERAYATMQGEMEVLAKALGKSAPGFNPLDAHADLKEKVAEGYLDEADALEIASGRARLNFEKNKPEPPAVTPEQEQQQGTQALSELGSKLRKSDASYDSKLPKINELVEQVVLSGAHPSTWAKLVEAGYKLIPSPIAPKSKPAITPNPIRPGNAGAGQGNYAKEPGSILEAIDLGLSRGR